MTRERAHVPSNGSTRSTRRLAFALALASSQAACILDLDGLTGGGGGGSGGQRPTCPWLDCTCIDAPRAVASSAPFVDGPRGLAVTAEGVYWASEIGNLVAHLPAGGSEPVLLAEAPSPTSLAASSEHLVWASSDGIHACSLPACGDDHIESASASQGSLRGLAFDGQTIAFADDGTGNGDGAVSSCALGACDPLPLATSLLSPDGVSLQGGSAFWVDRGNGNQNGSVSRSPKASASVSQIAASLDLPTGVAADDTYTYWTSEVPQGAVFRCAHATGYCDAPEVFRGSLARPREIVLAGGRVFWTSADDGTIASCKATGCGAGEPVIHAAGRQGLSHLAVSSTCLFWTEAGAVMRAPR